MGNSAPIISKQCKTAHGESNVWGSKQVSTYDFEYKTFDIDSITIYYWNVIQGFGIQLKNGTINYYGDKYFPNSRYKYLSSVVNLKKKKILGVNGAFSDIIDRIQFSILDVATETHSLTYQFGYSQVGTASSIESSLPNYHLTRIYGKVGPYGSGKAIQNLKFGYSYKKCV